MFIELVKRGAGAALMTLVMAGLSVVQAQPGPPGKKGKLAGPSRTVTGTVEKMTEAPRGEIDGAELSDGTTIHWPPHMENQFTAVVKKGDRVRVVGWEEKRPKGEAVLEVRSVTNLESKVTRVNEDAPPARKEEVKEEENDGNEKTVISRVKRFTEAPKGEIDGAELADGTVIHWPPHLSRKFASVARKSDAIEASGNIEKRPDGTTVLEVRTLTNLKTEESARNDGDGPPRPREKKEKK